MYRILSEIKRIWKAIWFTQVLKLFWNMLPKFFYDVFHFWLKIAHYNFRWEFANSYLFPEKLNKRIKRKRQNLNIWFLKKMFSEFIDDYKTRQVSTWRNDKKIRVLRRQWIESAPELVKICVNSIKKHNCWYEVVLLNKNNYKDYVQFPEYIIKKVEEKKITITHLSDIMRMALLKEYWGIWVDATMFINSDVFKEFDDININSNYPESFMKTKWWFDKWCWFFIWWKSNRLFHFCYDFFLQYHKYYDCLINYFLIDYAIYIAYTSFDDVKRDIDGINIHNEDLFLLTQKFNSEYKKSDYEKLMKIPFFKLTYKLKFDNKGNTLYNHFISNNIRTLWTKD